MFNLIVALAVVFGGLWLIRKLAKTPPGQVPALIQNLAGAALLSFAGLLALRGQVNLAGALFLLGLGLLGKGAAFPGGFPWPRRTAGQKSRVATSQLTMELDHDTGDMDGEIMAGAFLGRRLSQLSDAELRRFHAQCGTVADQSLALFEAWLDRSHEGWRARWGDARKQTAEAAGVMSRDEAYAVLGLKPGASATDIKSAHKRLMKEFHPDRGGSDYLAAKINLAKDVLLAA